MGKPSLLLCLICLNSGALGTEWELERAKVGRVRRSLDSFFYLFQNRQSQAQDPLENLLIRENIAGLYIKFFFEI